MKVTVDANILFSCLLRAGITRNIWFNSEITLYSPQFLLIEFQKHRTYLRKKYNGTDEEFDKLLNNIISCIHWVPDPELIPFLPAAKTLIDDSKDTLYIACALKEDTIIWSNDKHFIKQRRIKTLNTEEMAQEYGYL